PISPGETSQAIAPNDLITKEDGHHHHHKYPMNQDTIGAVAGVLGLLVHSARRKSQDRNSQACENEGNANVEHAPPFGPSISSFHEGPDHGKRRGYEEHDCRRNGKRTIPPGPWLAGARGRKEVGGAAGWLSCHRIVLDQMDSSDSRVIPLRVIRGAAQV